MRSLAIVALCVLVASARADTVVIVETRGAPDLPGLAQQVTVHSGARVDVQKEDADPLTFSERASQIVESGAATLVVWIAPVDHGFLVFVAGRATGRAVTELVRVDAALGTVEIERTIALKIAGLLDAIVVAQPVSTVIAAPVTIRLRNEWRIEASGAVAYDRHDRGADARVSLSVGRALRRGIYTFTPILGGYWQPSGTIERSAGRASLVELGATLAFDAAHDIGPVELFVRPHANVGAVSVRGVASDGRQGRTTVFAPSAGISIGAHRIVSNVRFGAFAACDFALIHRDLAIDSTTVVDLGVVRLHVGLAMTVAL